MEESFRDRRAAGCLGGGIMGRPLTFPSAAGEGGEGHSLVGVLPTPSFIQVSRREEGQSGPA